jgi:hypothetical protein
MPFARIAVLAASLVLACGVPVLARPTAVTVALTTSTAGDPRHELPPELFERVVRAWVAAATYVPGPGGANEANPDLAACRSAGATYAVHAAFATAVDPERARALPGRTLGVVDAVVVNCVTGMITASVHVPVASDPPTAATEGDYEASSDVTWRTLGAQLARTRLPIAQLARVARIDGPYVYVEVDNARDYRVGHVLRVYANAQAQPKPPVDLTITEIDGGTLQALYDTKNATNVVRIGDYAEPIRVPKS